MPLFQRLLNLDQVIQQTSVEPVLINDLPNSTEKELGDIFNKVTTQYFGDKISMLPSCQCGAFKSMAALGSFCPICNTVVQSSIENDIQSVLWFRCPEPITSLMSPIVYAMLRERFSKQGWDVIVWMTDMSYKPQVKMTSFMSKIIDQLPTAVPGFDRGWNSFCQHFDAILGYLLTIREFQVKKGEIDYLHYLWHKDRDKFFCKYLPLPNRSMFVYENTNMGIYRNAPTDRAIQYISLMMSIERSVQPLSQRAKENRIAKLYIKLSDYLKEHIKNELSPKPGQIRRHILATKNILAFRSVITSITKPHDHEAIEVPWGVGLTTFRPYLVNKLMRYGFSRNKCIDMLMSHIGTWHPLLDKFLNEMREEAPEGKIWTTIQRNPSLKQGSMQLVYISEFKRDPGDKTTGMPIDIVRAPNAIQLA